MKKQERLAPFLREPAGTLASVRYDPCTVYVRYFGWPRGGDDRVQGDGATGLATRCTVCGALVRRASLFEISDKHSFVAEDLDSDAGGGNLVSISILIGMPPAPKTTDQSKSVLGSVARENDLRNAKLSGRSICSQIPYQASRNAVLGRLVQIA
jgi:hypothetical protein